MKTIMKLLSVLSLVFCGDPATRRGAAAAPWKHQDIGAGQVPGTANHAAGAFTLAGTMDIWGPADGSQFAWQPLNGDVELVARVTAMDNPGGVGHAKASLCIRESLEPGSRNVTLCITPVDGTQFTYRNQTGGTTSRLFCDAETSKASVPKGQFPCWLKIVRRGQEFSGFESVDGEKWQLSGQIKLDLAADAVVGLTASSHKKDILTTATFDQVKLGKPTAPPRPTPRRSGSRN